MRVTDSDDIRRGYPFAALKNVILSPQVVVATAGNAALAMHTLRRLPTRPSHSGEVLPLLLESSEQAGPGSARVSYLVAVPSAGLWRVTHAGVEAEQAAAWIGSQDAFERYQRIYHEIPPPEVIRVPGISPAGPSIAELDHEYFDASTRMGYAIRSLQDDPSVKEVGEAAVSASSSSNGFRYAPEVYLAADHEQVIAGENWVPADWGTVAEGGFGYSMLVPTEPGIGLVALYFPHAGLGLLYHPLSRDDAFVYSHVNQAEFRSRVLSDHGVDVDGPTFGTGSNG